MNAAIRNSLVLALIAVTSSCVPTFTLVKPDTLEVSRGRLTVTTTIAWNRTPKYATRIANEESWTLNGPTLDEIIFIAGLRGGNDFFKRSNNDDRKIPSFNVSMTQSEMQLMTESYFRYKYGADKFEITGMKPTQFLGGRGTQIEFRYVGLRGEKRKGRSTMIICDDELFQIIVHGTELHYFDAVLPELEAIVRSAKMNRKCV